MNFNNYAQQFVLNINTSKRPKILVNKFNKIYKFYIRMTTLKNNNHNDILNKFLVIIL